MKSFTFLFPVFSYFLPGLQICMVSPCVFSCPVACFRFRTIALAVQQSSTRLDSESKLLHGYDVRNRSMGPVAIVGDQRARFMFVMIV